MAIYTMYKIIYSEPICFSQNICAEKGIRLGEDGIPLPNGDVMINEVWEIIHGAFTHSKEDYERIDPQKSLCGRIEDKLLAAYPDDA